MAEIIIGLPYRVKEDLPRKGGNVNGLFFHPDMAQYCGKVYCVNGDSHHFGLNGDSGVEGWFFNREMVEEVDISQYQIYNLENGYPILVKFEDGKWLRPEGCEDLSMSYNYVAHPGKVVLTKDIYQVGSKGDTIEAIITNDGLAWLSPKYLPMCGDIKNFCINEEKD